MKYTLSIIPLLLASMTGIYGQCKNDPTTFFDSSDATKNKEANGKGGKNKGETPQHAPIDVYLSSPAYSLEVDFSALFLQPTGSHLYYAAQAQPLPIETPDWTVYDLKTDYQFGFNVGLGWMFHSANSGLTVNWVHLHTNDSASQGASLSTNMMGPFFEIGPTALFYTHAKGSATFHFDEVTLDYGVSVNVGDRLMTNLFAGLNYTRIRQTLSSTFSNAANSTSLSVDTPSTFNGWGPQLGLDFTYRIVKGFHLAGDLAFDLLTGTLQNHTDYTATSPFLTATGLPNPTNQSTTVSQRMQVVPGIEGRLGLAYSVTFCKHYMIDFEAGYESKIFLNAVQTTDMGSEVDTEAVVVNTGGVYARTFQRVLSNFAVAGPYITLNLGF